MAEKPILFSGPMVRAILAGAKTQTRRVVKLPHMNPLGEWQPTRFGGRGGGQLRDGSTIPGQGGIWHTRTGDHIGCPFGMPGDFLWVRETWAEVKRHEPRTDEDLPWRKDGRILVYAADPHWDGARLFVCADGVMRWAKPDRWTPSIHMPRWASRIALAITDVRVERLHDISESDAIAEGVERPASGIPLCTPRQWYRALWESLNGKDSWDANPFVWVISFRHADSAAEAKQPGGSK